MPKLLVVDDEHSICWGLTRLGESLQHQVAVASSAEEGLLRAERFQPDVVVLDVRLPGASGLDTIAEFQRRSDGAPIIMITAYGDLQIAVEAIRRGAFDYIAKPFDVATIRNALARALASRIHQAPADTGQPAEIDNMVGRSPAMQSVYKQIALAAAAEAPVLLCGESGTGKELAARAIHRYSARGAGPFVAVNVAALNAAIAESELFGHVRGAFTGAEEARSGLLAMADGGTLFLDEVADIPLPTQVKLLRALERGEMLPVGGNEPIRSNFRVISATHRNLLRQVDAGAFRHDLYFRLCAFQVELPPLRTRTDDIPELAHHFVRALSKSTRPGFGISTEALQELSTRPWRGNVRELRNAIDHALIVARGKVIVPDDLPQSTSIAMPAEGEDRDEELVTAVRRWAEHIVDSKEQSGAIYDRLLEVVEPPLFAEAMKRNKAQFATAARALGIHRTTLRKKLADHGLDSPQDDD